MNKEEYYKKIDEYDNEILKLFENKMNFMADNTELKADQSRVSNIRIEKDKILEIHDKAPEELAEYDVILYSLLQSLDKSYHQKLLNDNNEIINKINKAITDTPQVLPDYPIVACQGVEGAFSNIACDKLFKHAKTTYYKSFGSVFRAIENGECQYGVIPLENSNAGSVKAVYDLMMQHHFYIVRSIRLKIDHNLLVKDGVKLEDIKEIYSHEQAINQCSDFLSTLKNVQVIPCENTAVAAKKVATSDRNDIAALSSRKCMEYYDLKCLKECVQNTDNNYTRFICISKNLEIFPGADRTSLMLTLPHEAGSLYKMLARFYANDISLNKIESRPIPKREFDFMFYFDLETPVYSDNLKNLIGEISKICDTFEYLGSYREII